MPNSPMDIDPLRMLIAVRHRIRIGIDVTLDALSRLMTSRRRAKSPRAISAVESSRLSSQCGLVEKILISRHAFFTYAVGECECPTRTSPKRKRPRKAA
jgi:hypothetical protein